MFTGLITHIAKVVVFENQNINSAEKSDKNSAKNSVELGVLINNLDISDIKLGESIALNGVCLTVSSIKNNILYFDISPETLAKTSLNNINIGYKLNLERALLASDRLGGHIVSGHVDCCASLIKLENLGEYLSLSFKILDIGLMRFISQKGSISIDGVSLTINSISDENNSFSVMIIPHTRDNTIISDYKINQKVNIEVDLLARYAVRGLSVIGVGVGVGEV